MKHLMAKSLVMNQIDSWLFQVDECLKYDLFAQSAEIVGKYYI